MFFKCMYLLVCVIVLQQLKGSTDFTLRITLGNWICQNKKNTKLRIFVRNAVGILIFLNNN